MPLAQEGSWHEFNQRWESSGEIGLLVKNPRANRGGCGFVFGFCNWNQVHEVIPEFQQEFIITCPNSSEGYMISESLIWTW